MGDLIPVVLSGSVFVDAFLTKQHADLALPDYVKDGDIKLRVVPKEKRIGHRVLYVGFICAYISVGKNWHKFKLRDAAQGSATYKDSAERSARVREVVVRLRRLAGRSAQCVDEFYLVSSPLFTPPVAVQTAPQAQAPKEHYAVQLKLL